jgi:hypothetical protein
MPDQSNYANDDEVLLNKVLQRSATDKEFRARLIGEPERAIEEITGVPASSLARPVHVKFVEKEPGLDALIVLPDFVAPDGALSDSELEAVAGGWCITSCTLSWKICTLSNDNSIVCES